MTFPRSLTEGEKDVDDASWSPPWRRPWEEDTWAGAVATAAMAGVASAWPHPLPLTPRLTASECAYARSLLTYYCGAFVTVSLLELARLGTEALVYPSPSSTPTGTPTGTPAGTPAGTLAARTRAAKFEAHTVLMTRYVVEEQGGGGGEEEGGEPDCGDASHACTAAAAHGTRGVLRVLLSLVEKKHRDEGGAGNAHRQQELWRAACAAAYNARADTLEWLLELDGLASTTERCDNDCGSECSNTTLLLHTAVTGAALADATGVSRKRAHTLETLVRRQVSHIPFALDGPHGHRDVSRTVHVLLARGARVDVCDVGGNTALSLAKQTYCASALKILESAAKCAHAY